MTRAKNRRTETTRWYFRGISGDLINRNGCVLVVNGEPSQQAAFDVLRAYIRLIAPERVDELAFYTPFRVPECYDGPVSPIVRHYLHTEREPSQWCMMTVKDLDLAQFQIVRMMTTENYRSYPELLTLSKQLTACLQALVDKTTAGGTGGESEV